MIFNDKVIICNEGKEGPFYTEEEILNLLSTHAGDVTHSDEKYMLADGCKVIFISNIFTFDFKIFLFVHGEMHLTKCFKFGDRTMKFINGCPKSHDNCIHNLNEAEGFFDEVLTDYRFMTTACLKRAYFPELLMTRDKVWSFFERISEGLFMKMIDIYNHTYADYIANKYDIAHIKTRFVEVLENINYYSDEHAFLYSSDELYGWLGIFLDDCLAKFNMPCINSKFAFMYFLEHKLEILEARFPPRPEDEDEDEVIIESIPKKKPTIYYFYKKEAE